MSSASFKRVVVGVSLLCGMARLQAQVDVVADPTKWKLVWADEFNGKTIDETRWHFEVNGKGGGNHELQYYTKRPANAFVENGHLVIAALKEDYTGPDGHRDYTSARLVTQGAGDWKYGRFEARLKLPKGRGLWPAFWMMPTESVYGSWPLSGEIDIMELIGHEPNVVYGTLHYGNPWPKSGHSGASYRLPTGDFSEGFHVFAVEWEPREIRWYVDGKLSQTQTKVVHADRTVSRAVRREILLRAQRGGRRRLARPAGRADDLPAADGKWITSARTRQRGSDVIRFPYGGKTCEKDWGLSPLHPMPADAALLAEVPLFQLLDVEERAALAAHLDMVTFPVGHVVFNYGEPGDAMYVVRSGQAELSFKNDTGEKIVLETVEHGDFFGELAFLDGGARSTTVVVTEAMEAVLMDRGDLEVFLKRHPHAALEPAHRPGQAAAQNLRDPAAHRDAQRQRGNRGHAHRRAKSGGLDRRVQRLHPVFAVARRAVHGLDRVEHAVPGALALRPVPV